MNCKGCMTICTTANKPADPKKCIGYIPKTNGNLFRAKTDEELADLFSNLSCPSSLGGNVDCRIETKGCFACWLDWLRRVTET